MPSSSSEAAQKRRTGNIRSVNEGGKRKAGGEEGSGNKAASKKVKASKSTVDERADSQDDERKREETDEGEDKGVVASSTNDFAAAFDQLSADDEDDSEQVDLAEEELNPNDAAVLPFLQDVIKSFVEEVAAFWNIWFVLYLWFRFERLIVLRNSASFELDPNASPGIALRPRGNWLSRSFLPIFFKQTHLHLCGASAGHDYTFDKPPARPAASPLSSNSTFDQDHPLLPINITPQSETTRRTSLNAQKVKEDGQMVLISWAGVCFTYMLLTAPHLYLAFSRLADYTLSNLGEFCLSFSEVVTIVIATTCLLIGLYAFSPNGIATYVGATTVTFLLRFNAGHDEHSVNRKVARWRLLVPWSTWRKHVVYACGGGFSSAVIFLLEFFLNTATDATTQLNCKALDSTGYVSKATFAQLQALVKQVVQLAKPHGEHVTEAFFTKYHSILHPITSLSARTHSKIFQGATRVWAMKKIKVPESLYYTKLLPFSWTTDKEKKRRVEEKMKLAHDVDYQAHLRSAPNKEKSAKAGDLYRRYAAEGGPATHRGAVSTGGTNWKAGLGLESDSDDG